MTLAQSTIWDALRVKSKFLAVFLDAVIDRLGKDSLICRRSFFHWLEE